MNWYKRAKLSLANLYDIPNYLSDVEKEYAQVTSVMKRLSRLQNAKKPNPIIQNKLYELDKQRKNLRMSLQMLNKLTPEEKLQKLKARQRQLI